jgi:hypothetical protein
MEQLEQRNPILEQEDYYKGYNEKIQEMRNKPEVIEFEKLVYELFEMNPQGKRFLELIVEKYLIPRRSQPGTQTFAMDLLWEDGYKSPFREIRDAIRSHQNRIMAGK